MNLPAIDQIYKGFVTEIDSQGYQVQLINFPKIPKGSVAKNLINPEDSKKLIPGRCVKVKVIAVNPKFLAINLVNIEKEVKKVMDNKGAKKMMEDRSHKPRVASPQRYQTHQFESSNEEWTVTLKKLPSYYESKALLLGLQELNIGDDQTRVFNSKVSIENNSMYRNGIAMASGSESFGQNFDTFYLNWRRSGQENHWIKDKKTISDLPKESAEDLKKLWSLQETASSIKEQRERLPISKYREQLVKGVADNKFLIIQGETGSGKSTQIPQFLHEAGFSRLGKIVCTQPRRIAAKNLAERVAKEQGVAVGSEVGYKYRGVDQTSISTLIKYCTEGTLMRELLNSTQLDQCSVIILDEAHERRIDIDVLLGYLKQEAAKRPHLRVIVSSATMEAQKFSKFLDNAKIIKIEGRTFPVEFHYRSVEIGNYVYASIATALHIHESQAAGDILLFLTGRDEIETAFDILKKRSVQSLKVFKAFSNLDDMEHLDEAFQPVTAGMRKLVISTNLAEASLTIPGIVYVIDCGYTKTKIYDSKTGLESLTILPISKASAAQRAGRAGRTAPGKCYRLYTLHNFNEMRNSTIPEIQRSNLANTVLLLKGMNVNDLEKFTFLDAPPKEALLASEKELYLLGALDEKGIISAIGRRMVNIPLDPNLSKMLIASIDLKCSDEIITIIGMMGLQNVFKRPKAKQHEADYAKASFQSGVSDQITYLNVYKAWEENGYSRDWCYKKFINEGGLNEARDVRKLLLDKMNQMELEVYSCGKNYERVQKAICAGLSTNVAKKSAGVRKYSIIKVPGKVFDLNATTALKSGEWMVYSKLFEDKKKEFIRDGTVINPEWLKVFASTMYTVTAKRALRHVNLSDYEDLSDDYDYDDYND